MSLAVYVRPGEVRARVRGRVARGRRAGGRQLTQPHARAGAAVTGRAVAHVSHTPCHMPHAAPPAVQPLRFCLWRTHRPTGPYSPCAPHDAGPSTRRPSMTVMVQGLGTPHAWLQQHPHNPGPPRGRVPKCACGRHKQADARPTATKTSRVTCQHTHDVTITSCKKTSRDVVKPHYMRTIK